MMNWKEDELWDAVSRKDLNGVQASIKKVRLLLLDGQNAAMVKRVSTLCTETDSFLQTRVGRKG